MARWKYTLNSGSALREAIYNEGMEQTVKCLLLCYKEVRNKLDEEDRDYRGMEIEDTIFNLENFDDGEDIDDYLEYFYDLCDELRVWVGI
jgi:hypothetical protein